MIHRYTMTVAGPPPREVDVAVEALDGTRWRVTLPGPPPVERIVDARRVADGHWSIIAPEGGAVHQVDVDAATPGAADVVATARGRSFAIKVGDRRRALEARAAPVRAPTGPQPVRAPMPGKVIKVLVRPGDTVTAGQGVVVVEAMKMENELRAPRDGKVVDVNVTEGQAVEANQALVTLA